MISSLINIIKTGIVTQLDLFPDLGSDANGLPTLTSNKCAGSSCQLCAKSCPTKAAAVSDDAEGGVIELDRGKCIGCNLCLQACPEGVIAPDRSTKVATRSREELLISNRVKSAVVVSQKALPFRRSLHVREVSTGCNASDLEVLASTNAIFDVSRFGISFVASPRFADALLVTGPVALAMQEPLRRCYEAMAEPKIVIAVGTSAISGGVHSDGYAQANGVANVLPVDIFIPGDPPHPWSIIHGLLLAMGRIEEGRKR